MRKSITITLIAAAFSLPLSYALAAPQHGGGHGQSGGHMPPSMPHMNNDAHGDAVSTAAHNKATDADDKNHGQAVNEVANDKNKGHKHHKHH